MDGTGRFDDAEYLARDNRKVTRLLKAAKLRLSSASMADAILDRLVHNAYKLTLRGPSGRKKESDRN